MTNAVALNILGLCTDPAGLYPDLLIRACVPFSDYWEYQTPATASFIGDGLQLQGTALPKVTDPAKGQPTPNGCFIQGDRGNKGKQRLRLLCLDLSDSNRLFSLSMPVTISGGLIRKGTAVPLLTLPTTPLLFQRSVSQDHSLEKTLESPLYSKEIKPINMKGNQLWIFIGRANAEAPILWSPDAKSQLIRKDAGKEWRQEEKGMTEDKMVGWHHWLNGHEFEQALGDGEGQGNLVCCRRLQRVGHDWATEQQSPEATLPQNFIMKLPISQFGSRELSLCLWWGNNTCIVLCTSKVLVQNSSTQMACLRSISSQEFSRIPGVDRDFIFIAHK